MQLLASCESCAETTTGAQKELHAQIPSFSSPSTFGVCVRIRAT